MLKQYGKKATVHGHLQVPVRFDASKNGVEALFTLKLEYDMPQLDCTVLLPIDYVHMCVEGFRDEDVTRYIEGLAMEDRHVIMDHLARQNDDDNGDEMVKRAKEHIKQSLTTIAMRNFI